MAKWKSVKLNDYDEVYSDLIAIARRTGVEPDGQRFWVVYFAESVTDNIHPIHKTATEVEKVWVPKFAGPRIEAKKFLAKLLEEHRSELQEE